MRNIKPEFSSWRKIKQLGALVLAVPLLAACVSLPSVGPANTPLSLEEQQALQDARGTGIYLAARQAAANYDFTRASQLFRKSLADNPDNAEVLSRTFFAALNAGEFEHAEKLARKIIERAPSAGVSRLLIAVKNMRDGNYQAIIDSVDAADDGTAILLEPVVLAWAYAGLQNEEKAIAAIDQTADGGGGQHFHDMHTALIYDYLNNMDAANTAYLKLLRSGGNGTRVAQAIGRFLERKEEEDQASVLRFYELYLKQAGRDTVIDREVARIKSGATAQRIVQTPAHGLSEALYFAASSLAADPRANRIARVYVQLSLMAAPDAEQSLLLMGQMLEQNDRPDQAIHYYDQVPASSAYGMMAAARAAMARSALGQPDEAIAAMQLMAATTTSKPERRNIYSIIGAIERGQNRWADAVQTYTLAIDALGTPEAGAWDLFYNRGMSHEQAGNWEDAERDLKRAIALDPNQPHLLNYLGYSWVDRGEHLDAGRQMIERAVELLPDDGFIVDSLGWVHYRLGNYKQAAKSLERAASLAPGEPVIIDHLGDALWKVGRRIEARFEWRRALNMNPDEDLAKLLSMKLDMGLERASNAFPPAGS